MAAVVLFMTIALYNGCRYAVYWTTQEMNPVQVRIREVASAIPDDARVLAVTPRPGELDGRFYVMLARLIPRPMYVLPPDTPTLESAGDWIREKRITWVISFGTKENPAALDYWKLDDRR